MNTRKQIFPLMLVRYVLLALVMLAGSAYFIPLNATVLHYSGEVEGRWTLDSSPIYITGDVTVPEGRQLIIEAGVRVLFLGNYYFNVRGMLIAEGTAEDGGRITFDRLEGGLWQGIYFNQADSRSRMIRCDILNASIGIDLNRTSPALRYNKIDAQSIGISCLSSSPEISNSIEISVGRGHMQTTAIGISLFGGSNAQIRGNERIIVTGGPGVEFIGILVDRSFPDIRENWIEVMSYAPAFGIIIRRTDKVSVINNIIRLKSQQSMLALWTIDTEDLLIRNNNFILNESSGNAIGIKVDTGARATVQNNIIWGNGSSTGIELANGTIHNSSGYNNLWQHHRNYVGHWQGFEDVLADPMFFAHHPDLDSVDNDSYQLRWDDYDDGENRLKSPCIDAGHPDFNDPDGTRSDIGRFYFHQYRDPDNVVDNEVIPTELHLLDVYPNPFNSIAKLTYSVGLSGNIDLSLFDIQGQRVLTLVSGRVDSGTHTVVLDGSYLPAGVYLARLTSHEGTSLKKLTLVK